MTALAGGVAWARWGCPLAATLGLAGVAAFAGALWSAGLEPTRHVYDATCWILVLWLGAHVTVGAIMQLYCAASSWAGRTTPRYDADLHNVELYWNFMAATALCTFALLGLFPLTTGAS